MWRHWILENPWPIALGLFAGGLFWIRRAAIIRRRAPAAIGLAAIAAGGLILLLGSYVETPVEQVNRVLDELAAAGLARDVQPIADRIADNFKAAEIDKRRLVERIEKELIDFRPDSLRLNGRTFRSEGAAVVVDFVAVTGGHFRQIQVNRYVIRARATFEKSSLGWQIVRLQRFDPLGNTGREIPLFSH